MMRRIRLVVHGGRLDAIRAAEVTMGLLAESGVAVELDEEMGALVGQHRAGDVEAVRVSFNGEGEPTDAVRAVAACAWSFPPGTADVEQVSAELDALRP